MLEQKVDTIRAVLGSAPGTSGEEVLNRIIAKSSQPQVISAPQMGKLAKEIAFFKDMLPKSIRIARSTSNSMTGADFPMYNPLNEMFVRNGIEPVFLQFAPDSVDETGLIIIVKYPLNAPEYVNKLLAAFELAGVLNVKLRYIKKMYDPDALTIFVGPSPI